MGDKFRWKKRGLIFAPDGRYEWMQSHAQFPAVLLFDHGVRVFFSTRPNRSADGYYSSSMTYVELDRQDLGKVTYVHSEPILPPGDPGTFDQFGMIPGSILQVGDEIWLYYGGWMRSLGVPYNTAIGLAKSRDGISFERAGRGPLFGRTLNEPFLQGGPFVMIVDNTFHMWYTSGIDWVEYEGHMESLYKLMHATSDDGIHWEREGQPSIPSLVEKECQAGVTVLQIGERFHMWFSYRYGLNFRNSERGYRIGYAWSDDLITWHRDDEANLILPSLDGWDSEMICYPKVINIDNNIYMFYNGNRFGQTGFGYAELEA